MTRHPRVFSPKFRDFIWVPRNCSHHSIARSLRAAIAIGRVEISGNPPSPRTLRRAESHGAFRPVAYAGWRFTSSEFQMAIDKAHDEFRTLDMSAGWETPAGYPAGIQQKILSGALDETSKRGRGALLLRFAPGVYTTSPFVHEYWEEVFLFSGDLTVGNDAQGKGGEAFKPNTYACRPPGVFHGPFKSKTGCLLIEMHYFDPA